MKDHLLTTQLHRELFGQTRRTTEFFTQIRRSQQDKVLAELRSGEKPLTEFYAEMKDAIIRFGDFSSLLLLIEFIEDKKTTVDKPAVAEAILDCLEDALLRSELVRSSLSENDLDRLYQFLMYPTKYGFYPQITRLYAFLDKVIAAENHLQVAGLSLKMKLLVQLNQYNMNDLRSIMNAATVGPRHQGSLNFNECLAYLTELISYGCHIAVETRKPLLYGMTWPAAPVLNAENEKAKRAMQRSTQLQLEVFSDLVKLGDPEALFHKSIAIICNKFRDDADRFSLIHDEKKPYLIQHFETESLTEGFNCLLLAEKQNYEPACAYAQRLRSKQIHLKSASDVEENNVQPALNS